MGSFWFKNEIIFNDGNICVLASGGMLIIGI
jgi:hypothetical protein